MFCKQCGIELSSAANFCSNCGSSVSGEGNIEQYDEQRKKDNTVYYDNGVGISVDSKVYNVNGTIYPINQISSIEIRKNPAIGRETIFYYGVCFVCLWFYSVLGNPWLLLGLLGPVIEYYAFKRVRWIFLKSGGSSERLLMSSDKNKREELYKIKNAVSEAISENS
ncbi:zinc-ribbon domain-containing protein [Vibrio splendidus]|nr:zinc-ribbon domain-containing protein [Vibrio splendidus]MCC4882832.1 zinc ribbon domain-containing protein [Vibrio splendidus]